MWCFTEPSSETFFHSWMFFRSYVGGGRKRFQNCQMITNYRNVLSLLFLNTNYWQNNTEVKKVEFYFIIGFNYQSRLFVFCWWRVKATWWKTAVPMSNPCLSGRGCQAMNSVNKNCQHAPLPTLKAWTGIFHFNPCPAPPNATGIHRVIPAPLKPKHRSWTYVLGAHLIIWKSKQG